MLDFHRKVCTRHDYHNLSSEFIHEESVNFIAEKYSQKLDILIFLKGIEYNFYQQKNNSFKGLWKYFFKEKKYSANPRLCIKLKSVPLSFQSDTKWYVVCNVFWRTDGNILCVAQCFNIRIEMSQKL